MSVDPLITFLSNNNSAPKDASKKKTKKRKAPESEPSKVETPAKIAKNDDLKPYFHYMGMPVYKIA